MEIFHHASLSQKRWGGQVDDYFEIHRFIDSTKVLCSDNRHRIFHTHWAVKEVVIPIFGAMMMAQEICPYTDTNLFLVRLKINSY